MRQAFHKERLQLLQTERVNCVHLVDDRLEVVQFVKAFKDQSELVTRDAAVIEKDAVDHSGVE